MDSKHWHAISSLRLRSRFLHYETNYARYLHSVPTAVCVNMISIVLPSDSLCVLKVCVASASALMNDVSVLRAGGERGEADRGHIGPMNATTVLPKLRDSPLSVSLKARLDLGWTQ